MNFKKVIDSTASIEYVYSIYEFLDFDYEYSISETEWFLEDKQHFIGDILNGFDTPKIYLIKNSGFATNENGKFFRYKVLNGKEMLKAINEFIQNDYPLSKDFIYLGNENVFDDSEDTVAADDVIDTADANTYATQLCGLKYCQLKAEHSEQHFDFMRYRLDIVIIDDANDRELKEFISRIS